MEYTLAKMLLQIEAVLLQPQNPFTWTSGMKSPIYCDNRLTISYPQIRKTIAKGFAKLIEEKFGAVDVVVGTATAGIPHAAYVSDLLEVPMAYVRGTAKGHGRENRIEGRIRSTDRVVVIEDLFSTGGSSIAAARAIIEDSGAEVLGAVGIFTYEFPKCEQRFKEAGLPFYTLTNYTALIQTAVELGTIRESDASFLAKWKEAPENFNWLQLVN